MKSNTQDTLDSGNTLVDESAPRAAHGADSAARAVGSLDAPLETLDFGDRYHREAVLGQGGMGMVLLSGDRQIGRQVAMKRLHPHALGQGDAESRFLREARVQGQLEHPAVVPVYDLGVDPDGAMYFTMKRVRGVTLQSILDGLREGRSDGTSRRRLLTAFSSVCLAVHFAHRHGVVHRDLKPGNIMLGDYGEVYVLDWGLARVLGAEELPEEEAPPSVVLDGPLTRETEPGAVLGTLGYMAPEQLRKDFGEVGPAADVYALGAILFEILTLEPLHRGKNASEVMESTLAGVDARPSVRAPNSAVVPELDEIVVRATAREPEQRYASARALNQALERFLDGERDLELRRSMAGQHADAASRAADVARAEQSPGFEARRRAMREIGRALALDPDNSLAMQTLTRLLTEPPRMLPPEVQTEFEINDRNKLRRVGRIGGFAYLSLFAWVPLMLWSGVREAGWVVAFFVAAGCASALSFWIASRPLPSRRAVLVMMVISNLLFACIASMFGPLLVMPGIVAVNAAAYTLHLDPPYRRYAIGTACLVIVGMLAAWSAGLLPVGYAFTSAGMTITPGALALPRTATIVILTVTALAMVLTGTLSLMHLRDSLTQSERQLFLYAWHLREFVPEAVRPTTDPTAERRERAVSSPAPA